MNVKHTMHNASTSSASSATSLANAVNIKQSMTLRENTYVTPDPYYALHPAYAVPYYPDDKHAIQALVEVDAESRAFEMTRSTMKFCPLRDSETIEWKCSNTLSVVAIYLLVYTRGE